MSNTDVPVDRIGTVPSPSTFDKVELRARVKGFLDTVQFTEGDAIKTPLEVLSAPWTTASYAEVQSRSNYAGHFMNSVIISVGSTIIALIIAIPAAWARSIFTRVWQ